ncbi:MAG: hypothetical protein ACUZ77_09470, partial [Candidatus Brocadiales bacterium]
MNSTRWSQLVILFMMAGVIIFISVRTVNTTLPKKEEVVYSYRGPDGTSWTHKDKSALERLREHYSLNSPKVFNRIEAERQPINKTSMKVAVALPSPRFKGFVWRSDVLIGTCALIIGLVSLYALRSSNGPSPELRAGNQEGARRTMPLPQDSEFTLKLKTIIIEFLYHLVTFSQENPDLRSDRFKELIDNYITKLKTTLPPNELSIIERELKKLVTQQWKLVKSLIEAKDRELKTIITTLVE